VAGKAGAAWISIATETKKMNGHGVHKMICKIATGGGLFVLTV
jgi:hypothetical protein